MDVSSGQIDGDRTLRFSEKLLLSGVALLSPGIALAYVGPGAGIGLLGALGGLLVAIVLAIGVVLIWPVRMMLRKRKARAAATAGNQDADVGKPAKSPREETA